MAQHNDLGRWGEQVAAEYLEEKGWYIRHRDWHDGHRDLDIVAIDEDMSVLVIAEVKTRATDDFGSPDTAIDLEKKKNLFLATQKYVRDYRLQHLPVRYDTISITGTPDAIKSIEHKENAFDVVSNYYFYDRKRRTAHYKKKPGCW